MAPTELSILTSFLLNPASLPQIITLTQFTNLFPKAEQSSPEIKRLYRSLQHRRALLTDAIAQNIDGETKRGNAQRRAVIRSRREESGGDGLEIDDEVVIENALFGPTSNLPTSRSHTITTIVPELHTVAEDIAAEIQELEGETELLLKEISAGISELSDLRYGRFANGQVNEEVLQGLGALEAACDKR